MQMHMNNKVFIRENNTKKCIILYANNVNKLITNYKSDHFDDNIHDL